MKCNGFFFTSCLVIGGGVYLMVATRPRSTAIPVPPAAPPAESAGARDSDSPSDEVTALAQQIATLRMQVDLLRNREQKVVPAPTIGVESQDALAMRADPEAIELQQQQWHEHMADVETKFEGETRDPRWATAVTTTVQLAFRGDDALAARLQGVDCRSRTCRVELVDLDPDSMTDVLRPILLKLNGALPNAQFDSVAETNGKRRTIIYMLRQPEHAML